jgi:hypothetical protein
MTQRFHCPICKATVALAAPSCSKCKVPFGESSVFKPEATIEVENPPASAFDVVLISVGLALLITTVFPIGARILQSTSGGMYGSIFKSFSPALYFLLSYMSNIVPFSIIVWLLLRYFKILERVHYKYRSTTLFAISTALILIYSLVRALAATVPGGGAGFVVASFSPFVLLPALVLLIIASVRLCIGYRKSMVKLI